MATLSDDAAKRLLIAEASADAGNEIASVLNNAKTLVAQCASSCAAVIVATNVSTTIDFAALKVGDKVVHIPAVAGNADFSTVTTAGTLPAAAVVGDLYVALRALALPAASAAKF